MGTAGRITEMDVYETPSLFLLVGRQRDLPHRWILQVHRTPVDGPRAVADAAPCSQAKVEARLAAAADPTQAPRNRSVVCAKRKALAKQMRACEATIDVLFDKHDRASSGALSARLVAESVMMRGPPRASRARVCETDARPCARGNASFGRENDEGVERFPVVLQCKS